jgi:hypothetical protein
MTAQEMRQEFLILYDKITNFDAPGYEDIEISIFLTKAQERVVLSRYRGLANKYQEGFEETEIRRKELQELVQGVTLSTPSTDQTNALPNGVFYDLPEDFLFAISEEITTSIDATYDECNHNVRLLVKPTTHDEYTINKKNPFKKPTIRNYCWRMDYNDDRHELITDGTYGIASYHLRYMKELVPIIIGTDTVDGVIGPQNCQLNQIIHKQIVDEAVKIATGITDPEKYQIKNIEQQAGE